MSAQLRWKLIGLTYLAVFSLILVLAYQGALPPILTQNDKLAHVVLYGIATFVGHQALHGRSIYRRIPLFPAVFTLFTILEEYVQAWSPNRTFDLGDGVASFIGIFMGWWCAQSVQNREPRK